MVTVLQNVYLSWDLESPVEYQAGQELQFTLHFSAPEAVPRKRKYYVLCALYTKDLVYISGTLFPVYVPPGVDYGIGSTEYASVWELEPGRSVDLPCRLTLDRSDVVLGLFLFKMVGDVPSLGVDEEVASVSAELVSPAPPWTIESAVSVAGMVMVLGMLGFMMYGMGEVFE